MGEAEVAPIHS